MYRRVQEMKLACLAMILSTLGACSAYERVGSGGDGLISIVEREELKGECIEIYRSRIRNALSESTITMDKDQLVRTLLAALPAPEVEGLARVGRSLPQLDAGDRDSDSVPLVMSRLGEEFADLETCGSADPTLEAYVFADQLSSYIYSRGVDLERLFPPNDAWEGVQESGRLMVALVIEARARGLD